MELLEDVQRELVAIREALRSPARNADPTAQRLRSDRCDSLVDRASTSITSISVARAVARGCHHRRPARTTAPSTAQTSAVSSSAAPRAGALDDLDTASVRCAESAAGCRAARLARARDVALVAGDQLLGDPSPCSPRQVHQTSAVDSVHGAAGQRRDPGPQLLGLTRTGVLDGLFDQSSSEEK